MYLSTNLLQYVALFTVLGECRLKNTTHKKLFTTIDTWSIENKLFQVADSVLLFFDLFKLTREKINKYYTH